MQLVAMIFHCNQLNLVKSLAWSREREADAGRELIRRSDFEHKWLRQMKRLHNRWEYLKHERMAETGRRKNKSKRCMCLIPSGSTCVRDKEITQILLVECVTWLLLFTSWICFLFSCSYRCGCRFCFFAYFFFLLLLLSLHEELTVCASVYAPQSNRKRERQKGKKVLSHTYGGKDEGSSILPRWLQSYL